MRIRAKSNPHPGMVDGLQFLAENDEDRVLLAKWRDEVAEMLSFKAAGLDGSTQALESQATQQEGSHD